MKLTKLVLFLIVIAILANIFRHRHDRNLLYALAEQGKELQQTKAQLQETKHLLANAEKKLGFLNQHKTSVHVTAFTGQGSFANGLPTKLSYAVPEHILPANRVLSIALSPRARRDLDARMNDYIVLLDKAQHKKMLARFVDTTSDAEQRPVVDVYFANLNEARVFGRQHYFAVNISGENSPFRQDQQ